MQNIYVVSGGKVVLCCCGCGCGDCGVDVNLWRSETQLILLTGTEPQTGARYHHNTTLHCPAAPQWPHRGWVSAGLWSVAKWKSMNIQQDLRLDCVVT